MPTPLEIMVAIQRARAAGFHGLAAALEQLLRKELSHANHMRLS